MQELVNNTLALKADSSGSESQLPGDPKKPRPRFPHLQNGDSQIHPTARLGGLNATVLIQNAAPRHHSVTKARFLTGLTVELGANLRKATQQNIQMVVGVSL